MWMATDCVVALHCPGENKYHCVCPSDPLRHLDYFEMLRNEDELALSKRFESVSEKRSWPCPCTIITINMYSCLGCFTPSTLGTHWYQKCHPSFWSHPQKDEPHRCIPALYVCAASLSPHATWVILWIISYSTAHYCPYHTEIQNPVKCDLKNPVN